MAEIVGALGVPHTPMFPMLVAREGPDSPTGRLFAEVRRHLEELRPDVLVIFDSDHLNTFFFDNLPTFAVGVTDRTWGPNDAPPGMERRDVPVHHDAAERLHAGLVDAGVDAAHSQRFSVDHSIMVPVHFLTPSLDVPIVPVFINGVAPPLPLARRCHALGQAVRAAVESWPAGLNVAVVASGSFSLEVGGPRIPDTAIAGVPDPDWAGTVTKHLTEGTVPALVDAATPQRLAQAGNVGGELLNWLALLGAIGDRRPVFCEPQAEHGHAYAAWRWDQ